MDPYRVSYIPKSCSGPRQCCQEYPQSQFNISIASGQWEVNQFLSPSWATSWSIHWAYSDPSTAHTVCIRKASCYGYCKSESICRACSYYDTAHTDCTRKTRRFSLYQVFHNSLLGCRSWRISPTSCTMVDCCMAVLWVINTLHDPHRIPTACQLPVPCSTAQVQSMVIGELYAPTINRHTVYVYDNGPRSHAISARLLLYSWACAMLPAPCLPSPMKGEPFMPPVDNRTIYAYCSTPCTHAYYDVYCPRTIRSVAFVFHVPGSHPPGFHILCRNPTRIPYMVGACRPLWPAIGLHDSTLRTRIPVYMTDSHQRGVTRITQVLGLILGVIVIGAPSQIVCPSSIRPWSGFDQSPMHKLSFPLNSRRNWTFPHVSHVGSTWKLHFHRSMPYVGRRHWHANG